MLSMHKLFNVCKRSNLMLCQLPSSYQVRVTSNMLAYPPNSNVNITRSRVDAK